MRRHKKVLLAALAAAVFAAEVAAQQPEAKAPATASPAWYIYSVRTAARTSWPEGTILLVISTEQSHLSKVTGLVFYDQAQLPELFEHFTVSTSTQLIGREVTLADRENPALEPIVKVGMSLSNIPDNSGAPSPTGEINISNVP